MELLAFPSVAGLPEKDWDALTRATEPLHTHLFNRCVEQAGVENAWFQYLLIEESGQALASATLSAFGIDLGLFLGKGADAWLRHIRRFFPGFLKIDILLCGLPASFGQANLAFAPEADREACLKKIAAKMEELAREKGIRYLCFKEFRTDTAEALGPLEQWGYFRAYSIPDTMLDLRPFAHFDAYLQALRAPYRRKIMLSLRKIGLSRPVIYPHTTEQTGSEQPVLLYGGSAVCSPDVFCRLYLRVMERAETKLETLNSGFFEQLYTHYEEHLVVLALWQKKEVLGTALLLPAGDTLIFLLVGMGEPKQTATDTYFNLVYGILEYAFQNGYQTVKTGQTAYPFKLRLGATPEALYIFFKAKNPVKHFLLKQLREVVFPETVLPRLQVFKRSQG